MPLLPTLFLLLIKPNFISERSIFPEQKAQILHLDKAETKPLFCQKYPFHFSFCPTSHQIKSTLTNIVTHPRSTFFGRQSVCYKKHHPALPVCHKHTGRGAGASPSPWAQLCLFTQAGTALMNSPDLTTFISPLLLVVVCLFQLCSRGSQSLRASRAAAQGEPSPALQDVLFHLAVHRQRAQGEGLVPWNS